MARHAVVLAALATMLFLTATATGDPGADKARIDSRIGDLQAQVERAARSEGVLTSELKFRGDSVQALTSLLDRPDVRAAAKCGPVLTSNHRLVPGVRWIMDLPSDQVIARSDLPQAAKVKSGIVVLAAGRAVLLRGGLDPENPTAEDTLRNLPPEGYRPVAANELYSVYARCR